MDAAIRETNRRRKIQQAYNEKHGITPKSVKKDIRALIEIGAPDKADKKSGVQKKLRRDERERLIAELTAEMKRASAQLEFERAAYLRDRIKELRTTKDAD